MEVCQVWTYDGYIAKDDPAVDRGAETVFFMAVEVDVEGLQTTAGPDPGSDGIQGCAGGVCVAVLGPMV